MERPTPLLLLACSSLALGACSTPSRQPARLNASALEGASETEDGFVFRSPDGRNELTLGGIFQVLGRLDDNGREPRADAQLKRMRPELAGRLQGGFRFQLEPKFDEDGVELEEAWVGPELPGFLGGHAQVHVGRMKAPFSLEEVRSRRHIDFPSFSILNQLVPAEDNGLFLNGTGAGDRWEYGLAVYNGSGASDTNSSKDVAARIMLHPFVDEGDSALRSVQVGVAGTLGTQDASVAGDSIDNETGLPVLLFTPAAELSGRRARLGLEFAWFDGPWFVQSELMAMRQHMEAGGPNEPVSFRGGYLTLSRTLTGEDKTFAGVVPATPHDFETGTGAGAWVAAVRLSWLDLDETLQNGFVVPGTFVDRIRTATAGLDWIPNVHTIVRSAVVATLYGDAVALGFDRNDTEISVLLELQLHF